MYFDKLELPDRIKAKLQDAGLSWFTFAEDCEAYKLVTELLEGEDWRVFIAAYERVLTTLTVIVDTEENTVQVVENPASYRADIQKPIKGRSWLFHVRSMMESRKRRMQRTHEVTLRQLNLALDMEEKALEEHDEEDEDEEEEAPKPRRGRLPQPKKAAICGQQATNGEKCSGVVAARYTGGGLRCLCEFHHEEATRFVRTRIQKL